MLAQQTKVALGLHSVLRRSPFERLLARGWALASVGYLVAILLYVLAQVLVNAIFNLGDAGAGEALALLFGRYLLITAPALLGCVNLAVRGFDHAGAADRPLFTWAVSGSALVAPLLVLFFILGLIGELAAGGSGGEILYEVIVQLAGLVVAVVAGAWALGWVGAHQGAPTLGPLLATGAGVPPAGGSSAGAPPPWQEPEPPGNPLAEN